MLTADPKGSFLAHEKDIRAAIDRVLDSGRYILGQEVEAFEREWSQYLGGGATVGVANGTDALELALRASGIGHGDSVATVANTVSATIAAIEQTGATPVFVEVKPDTMLMDPAWLERVLARGNIAAVIPVHLYGHMADMPAILQLADRHGIPVIEDCAQAHGASLLGRKAGTWGAFAAFSFYPTKNLGALGDAGAVYSRDPALAARAALLRQYGWRTRYLSEEPGRNSRLDELQAAILRAKLPHLDAENAVRARHAARYLAALPAGRLRLPVSEPGSRPVWHQFVVRTPAREALREHLARLGIHAAVLYPIPAHKQPAYEQTGLALPVTEASCAELLCLPCQPGLSEAEIDTVITQVLSWPQP